MHLLPLDTWIELPDGTSRPIIDIDPDQRLYYVLRDGHPQASDELLRCCPASLARRAAAPIWWHLARAYARLLPVALGRD